MNYFGYISMSAWRSTRRKQWTKIISLLMAATFQLPFVTWAFDAENYNLSGQPSVLYHSQKLTIPNQYGVIRSSKQAGNQVVVHIQDLHCNYEVQTNIAKIIDSLASQYNLKLVTIEGASAVVNTSKLGSFPVAEVKENVGRTLVKQGQMGGPEFYAATGRSKIWLEGLERRDLYEQNLKTVQSFLNSESQGYCYDLHEALDELKAKVYNPRLKDFDEQRNAFREGKMPMEKYGALLMQYGKKNQIATSGYTNLKMYLEKDKSPFPIAVDTDALYAEMANLDDQIRGRMYTNRTQAELDQLYHRVDVIEKLINVSATPAELAEFKAGRAGYSVKTFVDFIKSQNPASALGEEDIYGLDRYLKSVETFYQVVEERSNIFVDNVLERMKKHQTDIAVMVSGGYHTEGVMQALAARGVSFVSVTPRILHQDIVNPYFQLLQNRRSPLEKLLARNQNLIALPVGSAEVKDEAQDLVVYEKNLAQVAENTSPEALNRVTLQMNVEQLDLNSDGLRHAAEENTQHPVSAYQAMKAAYPADNTGLEFALDKVTPLDEVKLVSGQPVALAVGKTNFSIVACAKDALAKFSHAVQTQNFGQDRDYVAIENAKVKRYAAELQGTSRVGLVQRATQLIAPFWEWPLTVAISLLTLLGVPGLEALFAKVHGAEKQARLLTWMEGGRFGHGARDTGNRAFVFS
jgi:hypothetical protein